MNFNSIKTKLMWLVAAIILGAIGSGFWEMALKPGATWVIEGFWTLTLGLFSNMSDIIYTEVARGRTGRFDQFFWGGLLGIGLAIIFILALGETNKIKNLVKEKLKDVAPIIMKIMLAGFAGILIGISSKSAFVLIKISEYEQLSKIASPALSNIEDLEFISRFSRMRTSDEYDAIMYELASIAVKNNIYLPDAFKELEANK